MFIIVNKEINFFSSVKHAKYLIKNGNFNSTKLTNIIYANSFTNCFRFG